MRSVAIVLGLAVIGGLVLVVDVQSRVPVEHIDPAAESPQIFAIGRTEGATLEIELRPQLSGRIDEILVQEGQWVEKGETLLRLDDADYQCDVALASAELDLAKAQLDRLKAGARREEREAAAAMVRAKVAESEKAELSWKRISKLQDSKSVSDLEADNCRAVATALAAEAEALRARSASLEAPPREAEVRMDEARCQAAKARLEQAKVQQDRAKLRAPAAGQVLKVDARVGEIAGPASPQPAVIIADTRRLRVRAFIEELDAPKIRPGMRARVTADGLAGKEFRGRVVDVSPSMSRKVLWSDHPAERSDTKTREILIELDEGEGLIVGLRVEAMIDIAE